MPEPETLEYLTVAEVARVLRVHIETVRRMLRGGRLNGRIVTRQMGYRIPRSEVDRLLSAPNELESVERQARRIVRVEDRLNRLNALNAKPAANKRATGA